MDRSSRIRLAVMVVAVCVAAVAIWGAFGFPGSGTGEPESRALKKFAPETAGKRPTSPKGMATISGKVIDRSNGKIVSNVDVFLLGASGETKTTANSDGEFRVVVPTGRYRAFVRDDKVLTVGMQVRVRLDEGPRSELAGAFDPVIIPELDASEDARDIDLLVERAAILSGFIFEPNGIKAVEGAIVRVHAEPTRLPFPRPALGTDVVRTDEGGKFSIRVPAGTYDVEATHDKLAGLDSLANTMVLEAGREEHVTLDMAKGCIISGKVVRWNGTAAPDGALERDDADRPSGFGPIGRVEPDGSFRLAVVDEENIVLRAWPWKSPAAEDKTIACKDGKRFKDVVLHLKDVDPDLVGTVVDAKGAPVPLAFVDIRPLDWTIGGQQERADAAGNWHVYHLLSGKYQVTATAPGLGVADMTITSPRADVKLQLAGTGRIAGTTTDLVDGSFETSFTQCGAGNDPIELAPEPRIVVVRGGRFTIDRVPACSLTFGARWRDRVSEQHVVVEPDRTAYMELAVGAPREKTVRGIVRDKDHKPVPNARVTSVLGDKESATVRTDDTGHFSITTSAGAELVAGDGRYSGRAIVGRANVVSEEVDIALDDYESQY